MGKKRKRVAALIVLQAALAAALVGSAAPVQTASAGRSPAAAQPCRLRQLTVRDRHQVAQALDARRDVWGRQLLEAPDGPTYEAAFRRLPPLLFARGPHGRLETASGVYYLPFAMPLSVGGSRGFALHVADGSQIITRRAGGPSLSVLVGRGGRERFGSCLARLRPPGLAEGWLPILETSYLDAPVVATHRSRSPAACRASTGSSASSTSRRARAP